MLQNLLGNVDPGLDLLGFARNIALGALLALLLERVYTTCGHSLSNRQVFARNFFLLAMTTTLIITIVQSSLALSLGLIGALSIVRFRSAIKEPEELAYIFLSISIGLGMGGQPATPHGCRFRDDRRNRLDPVLVDVSPDGDGC